MEDALFGNKTIRQYFNCFSNQQWNKLARLTFSLGIQQLMLHDKRFMNSDFSALSIEQLEEIVGKSPIYF